ncbi:MAG TPA: DNA repair exonuclease [Cyanobacteria bacterium UBA8530]|nr:DNA repair exonuclease [Cyanobacteria bacterium UBA8530]
MTSTLRFLHLADLHLGNDQYRSPMRAEDMFESFRDALSRFAVGKSVDFVLLSGDLFDKRNISPETMKQAMDALALCREAEIPVLAIEGNHDRAADDAATWLRCLSDWGYLKLLAPEEDFSFLPWDEKKKSGGFFEVKDCRILGSRWYGASTSSVIPLLAKEVSALPPVSLQILMLHAGLEGKAARAMGGLSPSDLLPLKTAGIRYLALGHIHQRYEEDGWIFNPGSLEACSVAESEFSRGAYLVEISTEETKAVFLDDQRQRPFLRIRADLGSFSTPDEALAGIREILSGTEDSGILAPVVEFTTTGILNFPRHLLDSGAIEAAIEKKYHPSIVLLKSNAIPLEMGIATDVLHLDRAELEKKVIEELVAKDGRYQAQVSKWTEAILSLKNGILEGGSPNDLALSIHRLQGEP